VETSQSVDTFAAYLREPMSEDGAATWIVVPPEPAAAVEYPTRSRAPVRAARIALP
jgi:hypothetical protein